MQNKTKYFVSSFNSVNLARIVKLQIEKEFEFIVRGESVYLKRKLEDTQYQFKLSLSAVYAALQNVEIFTGKLDFYKIDKVRIVSLDQIVFDIDEIFEILQGLEFLMKLDRDKIFRVGELAWQEPELTSIKSQGENYWTFDNLEIPFILSSQVAR